jgi:hypothetical protein
LPYVGDIDVTFFGVVESVGEERVSIVMAHSESVWGTSDMFTGARVIVPTGLIHRQKIRIPSSILKRAREDPSAAGVEMVQCDRSTLRVLEVSRG